MSRVIICFLLACFFSGCKKVKEEVQENKAMSFITSGQWKVVKLIKGSTDYVNDFSVYKFQFHSAGKVDAIKNGTKEISGNWEGDMATAVIKANFPTQAVHPLPLLNGSWKISDGGINHVVAVRSENGETSTLRLERF